MTVNTSLLIAAPILQDYFVDKLTGFPLAGGIVSLYEDKDHTTYKNWYYQTGSAGGPYNFQPLDNPLTLSSVGTITDPLGNDVIPYFYPYDEDPTVAPNTVQKYYIVVTDAGGTIQFTRDNFPYNINGGGPTPGGINNTKNLIVNNEFWRNIGQLMINPNLDPVFIQLVYKIIINSMTYDILYTYSLAPSQHDNFIMPDICLIKDNKTSTETITFANFVFGYSPTPMLPSYSDQVLPETITPEYYINYNCTIAGSTSVKYIQIPIQSNITALSGAGPYSVSICAMAVTGSPSITVQLFQFAGTGVNSPLPITLGTISLTQNWQIAKFTNISMPSAQTFSSSTVGAGQDDGFYLVIGLPKGSEEVCNINIAKPSFYLSNTVPTNDWQTYDEINTVISSPKTGEVVISANAYYQFGWVPMNDGVIGNTNSSNIPISTRALPDTWILYDRLWKNNLKFDTGANFNPICQMFTASGTLTPTNYGTNPYDDFVAGKGIQLTKMFGRVICGTVPYWELLSTQVQSVTASGAAAAPLLFTISPVTFQLYNGQSIYFTIPTGGSLPGNIAVNTIYYVANINLAGAGTFNVATTYARAVPQSAPASPIVILSTGVFGSNVSVSPNYTNIYDGENAHWQQTNEVGTHNHVTNITGSNSGGPGSNAVGFSTGADNAANKLFTTNALAAPTQALNITQLEAYYNIFMKL